MTTGRRIGFWICLTLALGGCRPSAPPPDRLAPSGFVLISASSLRADALGSLGSEPSSSPFLDSLARRSLVFERAFSPSSDTLVAHVSLLSGRYPAEHLVVPPATAMAAEVPVLAELFSTAGYETGAYTHGGYLSQEFGFDRGFDSFEVLALGTGTPFFEARSFLEDAGVRPFFLFLHSDAIEAELFGLAGSSGEAGESGAALEDLMRGRRDVPESMLREIETRYEEGVRRLDSQIASFFGLLEDLGLDDRTLVAITSDHGFEFGEHGRWGHDQLYPESLRVPLLLRGPGVPVKQVSGLVQTVDVAPSLLELAGIAAPALSARLLPGVSPSSEPRRWAVAEKRGRWSQRSVLQEVDGRLTQGIWSRLRGEHDGIWVTGSVSFDTRAQRLDFSAVSFPSYRSISAFREGGPLGTLRLGPEWSEESLELGADRDRKRIELVAEDCVSPRAAGAGSDGRCLSFKLRGLDLSKLEVFDLDADPQCRFDLSGTRPELAASLRENLARPALRPVVPPERTTPRPETLAAIDLRAELPEPPGPPLARPIDTALVKKNRLPARAPAAGD